MDENFEKIKFGKQIKLTKLSTLASGFPEEVSCQRVSIILNRQNAI